ncbi:TPA: type I DNA topoisomerase [Candidatus Saccharibacteria bacterium]|nr:type I DNA topoisomerase [Candidatus Saccharibacteria bacterium]HIO87587.1 type I DNA topoisomerase [Candidatus Saccharibacteria bacterium]
MSKNLVIVESPAKAKTIEKYLGKDYKVLSSFGHIRDLPKKGMSVDIENDFEPTYEVNADKKKTVSALKKAVKEAETVWLASDEDREGEAIAWHLKEALKLKDASTKRITFHEITKPAIETAIKNPRDIDYHRVDAQQARRVLDRVVGYELSPLLWRKVQPGLSAGRVQSVAVRLVVEREREIQAHEPETSFKTSAVFAADGEEIQAKTKDFASKEEAKIFLETAAQSDYTVQSVEKKPGKRNPSPPFTTSSLQQTASSLIGFSPRQTMRLAQGLYEAGHITYMRTDSLNLSDQALTQAEKIITSEFGSNYHHRRTFKTKSKGAQEAHEAIRPTNLAATSAGKDERERKLYQLIRERALASQMAPAATEKTTLVLGAANVAPDFIAKGEVVTFPGFLAVQSRRKDDSLLPDLTEGQAVDLVTAESTETLSRGPARYTEASLIKALEERGIGRPTTYAPTISTIQDRKYVEKRDVIGEETEISVLKLADKTVSLETAKKEVGGDKNKLVPTTIATIVTDFLTKHIDDVVDYDFTAKLEAEFDEIAEGKAQWKSVLKNFYKGFHDDVEKAADVSRKEASQARTLGTDPKSGKPVIARLGRYGPMVQIGEAEDEEKPKFAPLPDGANLETVTLEQALKGFDLPRTVGKTADGEEIIANKGRFGPYVKYGSTYVNIKDYDPFTIDETTANELIAAHKEKLAKQLIKDFKNGIQIKDGRFGPYITDGKTNAKVPKDVEPSDIDLEKAKELLEARKKAGPKKKAKNTKKKKTK